MSGLHWWLSSKDSIYNSGATGEALWRKAQQSTPVFLPGESHRQRSLADYSPKGPTELDMTEVTQHSGMHVYVSSLLNLPPTAHPTPPFQVVTELPVSYSKFPLLSILHMIMCVFPCYALKLPALPSPSHTVFKGKNISMPFYMGKMPFLLNTFRLLL